MLQLSNCIQEYSYLNVWHLINEGNTLKFVDDGTMDTDHEDSRMGTPKLSPQTATSPNTSAQDSDIDLQDA